MLIVSKVWINTIPWNVCSVIIRVDLEKTLVDFQVNQWKTTKTPTKIMETSHLPRLWFDHNWDIWDTLQQQPDLGGERGHMAWESRWTNGMMSRSSASGAGVEPKMMILSSEYFVAHCPHKWNSLIHVNYFTYNRLDNHSFLRNNSCSERCFAIFPCI